jgi:cell division protein FtsL
MRKKVKLNLFSVLSSFFAIASICVIFCLLYVWQKNQVLKTGYRINVLKKKIDCVQQATERIESKIEILKSPDKILQRIPPDLKMTASNRIVHLPKIDRAYISDEQRVLVAAQQSFFMRWLQSNVFSNQSNSEQSCFYVQNNE